MLHDVGEDTGGDEAVPFLVMEFIEGRTLAEVLGDGPLTMERATAIMRDVADALAHSHAQGLVHRGSTTTVALVASWLTALVLTFLRPGLAGAFAAVAPATLLSVRDDMPGTVILALLAVACAVGVFYRAGMAAQALSYGAILCAGPVIANATGYYGEGATFLLLAAAACTALAAVRHPRRHGEG